MEADKIQIQEESEGWSLHIQGTTPRHFSTAAKALTAVREYGVTLAGETGSSVLLVEWFPKTTIGRQVVKALQ